MASEKLNVTNALEDICKITTIPPASMHKLFDKIAWCICNSMHETVLSGESQCDINIGIGNLIITNTKSHLEYKFIPSAKLERGLIETVLSKKNPLEVKLEETFVNRIVKTYKDML